MQNIFNETSSLDKRCCEKFLLTEDILMEHAADGMADFIYNKFELGTSIIIVCGAGNNGADGTVLARLLHNDYDVKVYLPFGVKSEMAQLQYKRLLAVCDCVSDVLVESDIIVDALFGTGLSRALDTMSQNIIDTLNSYHDSYKIACDIPSGMGFKTVFEADITLTMGALKRSMFEDSAKEYVGDIEVINLGVSRGVYERDTKYKLLETLDMKLPHRTNRIMKNAHKGSFGHLSVVCGEKEGAAIIASLAAFNFGAGLVTLLSNTKITAPCEIMQSHTLPSNTTAITLGMGLGQEFSNIELDTFLENKIPLVLDADIFYHDRLKKLLSRDNIIITPHPKEFVALLKRCSLAEITIAQLQQKRFEYVELFHKSYPLVTLLLKGANVIIASNNNFYVNTLGTSSLAKGGSGDVLSGLIAALLAQGYSCEDAAISASLAHTMSYKKSDKSSFAITPTDLISGVQYL